MYGALHVMRESVLLVSLPLLFLRWLVIVPLALLSLSLCSPASPADAWITHISLAVLCCAIAAQIRSDTPHAAPPPTQPPLTQPQRSHSASPPPPIVVMDYDEEQRNEIEALEAIFDADFTGTGEEKRQTDERVDGDGTAVGSAATGVCQRSARGAVQQRPGVQRDGRVLGLRQ